ncbi:MAG TPA: 4-hydroxy-tetrahydrodipicolinate reductase [Armatimonadota bacterium]|nr:4-hydroxy-tetrahydrodipicolinate reductase [Armatimonadota bacterium]
MVNIGIIGLGLTGSAIAKHVLEQCPDLRIVLAGAGPKSAKTGCDLGTYLGLPATGVAITSSEHLPAALRHAHPDAVIDFSRPEATLSLLRHYAAIGCGVVVGTTGFSDSQIQRLQHAAGTGRFGLMYAPNITRGVNVLMMLAKLATRYLPGYDIEIIERHHRRKKDSPSGTANKIAHQLHDVHGDDDARTVHGREGCQPRDTGEIGVHAVRAGGIVGVHEILFAGDHDEITITHRSESRLAFAAGAIEAAVWVAAHRGYFTVEDMIMSEEVRSILEPALPAQTESDIIPLAV